MLQTARTPPAWRRYAVLGLVAVLVGVVLVVVGLVMRSHGGRGRHVGQPSPSQTPPSSTLTVPSFPVAGPVPAAEQQVLDQRVGFGGKVTGGAGGTVVHVTTSADTGPGSLRDALSGDQSRWIVFDADLTIRLTKPIAVGSNKTVDGRGHHIEITGPGVEGLDLINDSNVILESLTMHDFGNVAKTSHNNKPDAIHLDHARGVWVDHCDLSMAGDKLIAVSDGSSGITVSWTHLHDQEQVFQIGNQATGKADRAQTVTIEHNFFDHTGYRNPVVAYGTAHVYDNYYLGWNSYAVRSERLAQVYLQDNVFEAGANKRATVVRPHGSGCNDKKTHCDDNDGYLKSVGNLMLKGAHIKNSAPNDVFDPAQVYHYTAEPATPQLASRIAAQAGPLS